MGDRVIAFAGLIRADARALPLVDGCVQTCVTSPPYWGLRDYGLGERGIGLEPTPEAWVKNCVEVFREVRRVLKPDGTLWVNCGDSYAGSWGAQGRQGKNGQMAARSIVSARQIAAAVKRESLTGSVTHLDGLKPKDLIGLPWMLAFALRADGWWLRADIIWHKPNPMPESIRDRPTKAHEYLFLLSKSARYYWNAGAIAEPALNTPGGRMGGHTKHANDWPAGSAATGHGLDRGCMREHRNARSVWTFPTQPRPEAHFATFPDELPRRCILAGSRPGDLVLDPFVGSGTTVEVAVRLGRRGVGTDLGYHDISARRTAEIQRPLPGVA